MIKFIPGNWHLFEASIGGTGWQQYIGIYKGRKQISIFDGYEFYVLWNKPDRNDRYYLQKTLNIIFEHNIANHRVFSPKRIEFEEAEKMIGENKILEQIFNMGLMDLKEFKELKDLYIISRIL